MLPVLAQFQIPTALILWMVSVFVLVFAAVTFRQSRGQGVGVLVAAIFIGSRMLTANKLTISSFFDMGRTTSFTIYGYGFMLSMTFVVASTLLYFELGRKRMDQNLVGPVTILAVIFGLVGSKLFDAFENWDRFMKNPGKVLWGSAGLTYLGGFLLATTAICLFLWLRRVSILKFCDATTPGLMIGYGIARIGCQLSGDGDYGIPTSLPWGMAYPPPATKPTLEIVHPTPVYETLASILLFAILWRLRKRQTPDGWLFCLYLMVSGAERFLIEFIRVNPRWFLGLSQSQLISLGLMVLGAVGMWWMRGQTPTQSAVAGGELARSR